MDINELTALYEQYLGRAPDPSGIATWSSMDPAAVTAGITGSQEYQQNQAAQSSGGGGGGGGGSSVVSDGNGGYVTTSNDSNPLAGTTSAYNNMQYVGTGGLDANGSVTYQYKDANGGLVNVDGSGAPVGYTPSQSWYQQQYAAHPDAIRTGMNGEQYLAAGPLAQTTTINGVQVPINATEYQINPSTGALTNNPVDRQVSQGFNDWATTPSGALTLGAAVLGSAFGGSALLGGEAAGAAGGGTAAMNFGATGAAGGIGAGAGASGGIALPSTASLAASAGLGGTAAGIGAAGAGALTAEQLAQYSAAGVSATEATQAAAAGLTAADVIKGTQAGLGIAQLLQGAGAALGIVPAAANLFGKNLTGTGSTSATDPYAQYRPQAAQQLNTLMNNPSAALSQPGYQQQLAEGMKQSQRGAAATGQLQSGAEMAALNQQGQNTFGSYYNTLVSQLMQMSGASQSPANAAVASQQIAASKQNVQNQNLGTITSGLGSIASLYGNAASQSSSTGGSSGVVGGYQQLASGNATDYSQTDLSGNNTYFYQ